ncbi:MAG TPA: sulfite exporter TauE/SafE family protein [Sorangium sp.]|nr:sulfite exporter TauE/SafE family protein [Sorangium sp.]
MACWIAALGACIGVVAGLLGAGPSILTVLLLERAGGLDLGSAISTSLVVVATMSLVALVPHAKAGAVLWRAAASFGLASMAGAYLGGRASALIPTKILTVIFLVAMMLAAVAMLWRHHSPVRGEPRTGICGGAVLAAGGLLVGGLTGLVGLGGGFAVVPLLLVFARAPVHAAIGTSILVIAMNTLAGLAGHLPRLSVDWQIATTLIVTESAGSLAGARLARRVSAEALRRAFAGIMLVAAVFMLGSAVLR